MTVYVLEAKRFGAPAVHSVWGSVEAAMAAHPGDWKRDALADRVYGVEAWARTLGHDDARPHALTAFEIKSPVVLVVDAAALAASVSA